MAGLFAKVVSKAKSEVKETKKASTVWVTDNKETSQVGNAVKELVKLSADAKAITGKMELYKGVVKRHAEDRFIGDYTQKGVFPDTPMQIQNSDGERVTFVVQDRSGQYAVKEDQQEALADLLGEEAAKELLYEETSFGLDRDILAIEGVSKVVEAAIEAAIKKLTSGPNPILNPELGEKLLTVDSKVAFKPGTLDRLVLICGRDTVKMKHFIDIAGSSITKYVKC